MENFFQKEILPWYKKNKRRLPWRRRGISAYEVWVSEIMLQQTQVSRVVGYYERFLIRFPTVSDLAQVSWEEFLPYYDGLGYYNRGRNMLRTAKVVSEEHSGHFPKTKKILLTLPGVGEYTASAILAFAYNEPEVAFDTNFKKVFASFAKDDETVQALTARIKKSMLASSVSPREFNSAIMDYGSAHFGPASRNGAKEKNVFPTKDAQALVFLHKDHKEYYSLSEDHFEPFVLPPGHTSRAKIKEYFHVEFGLNVAVRPPHKKTFLDELPTLFVNAQILSGEHEFSVFSKGEMKEMGW